ncbi:MAG: hypothetical protein AB1942_13660 [Pseudomonadota bacterium]
MTAEAAASGKLDIGRVLGETFKVIGRNFIAFAGLGLILAGIPTGVIGMIQGFWLQGGALADGNLNMGIGYITNMVLGVLVTLVATSILQGALIHATVQDMNGQKPVLRESLANGLRFFLPMIGLSILIALGTGLGMLLLIVPGIMAACAWCVAGPALVAERTGVFGAFGRSAALTRGNRWRLFGLFVVIWLVLIVLIIILGAVLGPVLAINATTNPTAAALSPITIGYNVIQQTLTSVIAAALTSVLYVELRRAKEGLGAEGLAEIFS